MRKILLPISALMIIMLGSHSCRMAPQDNPGDTIAAKYFEPRDPAIVAASDSDTTVAAVRDSADIFILGKAPNKQQLTLISYPSRRDTIVRTKGKQVAVSGVATEGHVVRVKLWTPDKGDTLITQVAEMKQLPRPE